MLTWSGVLGDLSDYCDDHKHNLVLRNNASLEDLDRVFYRIIEEVVGDYGFMSAGDIGRLACRTRPMCKVQAEGRRGDLLDFSNEALMPTDEAVAEALRSFFDDGDVPVLGEALDDGCGENEELGKTLPLHARAPSVRAPAMSNVLLMPIAVRASLTVEAISAPVFAFQEKDMDCTGLQQGDDIWVERTLAPSAITLTNVGSVSEHHFEAVAYPGIDFQRADGSATGHPFQVVEPGE